MGGDSDDLTPEVHKAELRQHDTLLLCTDGLTKCVADAQIAERLTGDERSEVVCQQLVSEAISEGVPDNTTVVVARFVPTGTHFEKENAVAGKEHTNRIEEVADTAPRAPLVG